MIIEKFQRKNENLIIFFSGFMMNPELFDFLSLNSHDLFFIYDYRNFELDETFFEDIESYFKVNLVAFSLGVTIAATIMKKSKKELIDAIAINGTLKPINDFFGIPEKVFNGTLENLSEDSLDKFYRRVFGSYYDNVKKNLIYNVDKAKTELLNMQGFIQSNSLLENIYYKAIVSEDDRIFPPTNQISFWQKEVNVIFLQGSHFPFYKFKSWDDILNVNN